MSEQRRHRIVQRMNALDQSKQGGLTVENEIKLALYRWAKQYNSAWELSEPGQREMEWAEADIAKDSLRSTHRLMDIRKLGSRC